MSSSASIIAAGKPVLNAKYNNLPTHTDPTRKGQKADDVTEGHVSCVNAASCVRTGSYSALLLI
jgi:hypothetical protein